MPKNIFVLTIKKPLKMQQINLNEPFACLLYSNQDKVTADEMLSVANWLISSGSRYVVCAGLNCSEWHDAIDTADIILDPESQKLVMTSWHENESIQDIVWYWLNATNFDEITFENYFVLFVGDSKVVKEEIQCAINESNYSFVAINSGEKA